jgi:hypothetical protein
MNATNHPLTRGNFRTRKTKQNWPRKIDPF